MWDNIEDAFKDLDSNEYNFFAKALGSYQKALEKEGFNRREAFRLVESYAKFVYDMVIEELISKSQGAALDDDQDDDLGVGGEDEV